MNIVISAAGTAFAGYWLLVFLLASPLLHGFREGVLVFCIVIGWFPAAVALHDFLESVERRLLMRLGYRRSNRSKQVFD